MKKITVTLTLLLISFFTTANASTHTTTVARTRPIINYAVSGTLVLTGLLLARHTIHLKNKRHAIEKAQTDKLSDFSYSPESSNVYRLKIIENSKDVPTTWMCAVTLKEDSRGGSEKYTQVTAEQRSAEENMKLEFAGLVQQNTSLRASRIRWCTGCSVAAFALAALFAFN